MQVFNTFFKIAREYKKSVLVYGVVFLILLIVMSKVGAQNSNSQFVADTVNFAVVDEDNTSASQALIDFLSQKHNLVSLKTYSKEELQDSLFYEKISYILYIKKGYQNGIETGNLENLLEHYMRKDSAKGYFFNQDINSYLSTLKLYSNASYSLEDALEKTKTTASKAVENEVKSIGFDTGSTVDSTVTFYFQYLPYIMMGCLIVAIAPILISFHKKDLAERLACSTTPVRSQKVMIGLACITYCLAFWLVFSIIPGIVFGPSKVFTFSGMLFIINSLIYTLFVISLVLLLGSFNINQSFLNLIANVIALGSSFLCGIFVPQWLLADSVLSIAKFLPAYWYIRNINMISGNNGDSLVMNHFWQNIGMQALFVIATASIFLMISNQKRAKA